VQVYGPKMLRYKGVLNMKGSDRKVIFQGVHQLMGSDLGPKWAPGEKRSKMVFIGIDLPKDVLLQGLDRMPRLRVLAPAVADNRAPLRGSPEVSKPPAKSPATKTARPSPPRLPPRPRPPSLPRPPRLRGSKAPAPVVSTPTATEPTERFAPAPRDRPRGYPEDIQARRQGGPQTRQRLEDQGRPDLTEAELLAMPDSEYMNDKQLEFFRAKLQQLKDDLLSNAGETTEHLREDTSIVPDPADRATIEEEHALELRTRDRERKLLKKISQSIARLDSGEYGYCDETGEPIGLGRLLARPRPPCRSRRSSGANSSRRCSATDLRKADPLSAHG
jgi:DnaK suppressor protein